MNPKYTILKAIIQTSNKAKKTDRGFTLLELIVGLLITVIVGGLAMNALIQASTSFGKDKRSIDSSQNLSAILEIIGNDLKQAGEGINATNFPAIEFNTNTDAGSMSGSSKIIIRRALTDSLTLCETITANQPLTMTSLLVADSAVAPTEPNCAAATSTSPLTVYRVPPTVTDPPTPTTYPTTPATAFPSLPSSTFINLPVTLRKVRDYRCELDDPNPSTAYDSPTKAREDFCRLTKANPDLEKLRIAVSDADGHMLIFNQTDETADTGNSADDVSPPVKKYSIAVNKDFEPGDSAAVPPVPADPAIVNNTKNNAVEYKIGSPIYVIEERVYTLTSNGDFKVSIDGKAPETLIKKVANFRISAKKYSDPKERTINPTPTADVCTDAAPFAAQPTTATITNPKYICKFNYYTGTGATDKADWKTLAGIKVELKTKYDGTGQSATASTQDDEKLSVAAEFFPRNVLSK